MGHRRSTPADCTADQSDTAAPSQPDATTRKIARGQKRVDSVNRGYLADRPSWLTDGIMHVGNRSC